MGRQTHDIKTRIGMMTGTTAEGTHIAESIGMMTMGIMSRREVRGMLTTATLMNL